MCRVPNSFNFVRWILIDSNPADRYSGDLMSRLFFILNGQKENELQMVWFSKGIWNQEAQPFEIRTKSGHFIKNHLKSRGKLLDFKCVQILNGRISDPHCTWIQVDPNTGHYNCKTIWKPDNLTTGHKSTIWIPDWSGN